MNITIRQFDQDDVKAVLRLMDELGYPLDKEQLLYNIKMINRGNGVILVAETGRSVIGCLSAVVNAGLAEGVFGEIVSLVVSSEYRGAGVGTRLVKQAEDLLRPRVDILRVRANSVRSAAHKFYKSLGFKEKKTQISFVKPL